MVGFVWAGTPETTDGPQEKAKASSPAPAEKAQDGDGPVGHIGTLVAVSLGMRTVVVDIPLEKGVLRVGADVTEKTTLTEGGKRIELDALNRGDRVRLEFQRVPHGDIATALERLAHARQ
ncbi:MAG: hypothetical protein A2Z17_01005 [Gammaproteobacteria bacterium RBG_16_66_13]|nr:MAG: hypothetical protein A2Z17_01005 [Gammaproteobacteria bacterium RBG_16_66_13]